MPVQGEKQVALYVAWQANPDITASGLRTAVGVAVETAKNYKSRFETGFIPDGAEPVNDMPTIVSAVRHDSIEWFPVNMVTDYTIQANSEAPDVSWMREKLFEAELKKAEVLREYEACYQEVWHWQELLRLNEPDQT